MILLCCATAHVQFLPFYTLPLESQRQDKGDPRASNRQDKRGRHREIVRFQHTAELIRWCDLSDVSGTGTHNDPRVDTGGVQRDLLDEGIGEDVLCDRDGNGPSEGVEKDGHGISDRHVLFVQHDLDGDEGNLDTCTGPESSQNLISNPGAGGRVGLEGIQ